MLNISSFYYRAAAAVHVNHDCSQEGAQLPPSLSHTHAHILEVAKQHLMESGRQERGKLALSKAFQTDLCEVMLQDSNCTLQADACVSQHQTTSVWRGRSEG